MAFMSSAYLDGHRLDTAWDFGDPAASEDRLRALLGEVGQETIAGAEVTTQIARALGLLDRFAAGHTLLDSIESEDPIVVARIALERGRLLNSEGNPAAAEPYFRQAVEHAVLGDDDFLHVDALHMLAIADPAAAERWTESALAIAAASDDARVRRWIGSLQNNLGWSRHDAGRYPEALAAFQAALVAYETTGSSFQIHVAHWSVARCLRSLGQYDDALAIQTRLQREDEPDPYVDEEIGLLRTALGDRGEQ